MIEREPEIQRISRAERILRSFDNIRGVTALKPLTLQAMDVFEKDGAVEISEKELLLKIKELNPPKNPWHEIQKGTFQRSLDVLENEGLVAWRWVSANEAVEKDEKTGTDNHMGRFYHRTDPHSSQNS